MLCELRTLDIAGCCYPSIPDVQYWVVSSDRLSKVGTCRAPVDDMPFGHKVTQKSNGRFDDSGFVVKLNDQWQINHQPQQVSGMYFAFTAKSRDATKNHDTMYPVLVMQNIDDFLHQ